MQLPVKIIGPVVLALGQLLALAGSQLSTGLEDYTIALAKAKALKAALEESL